MPWRHEFMSEKKEKIELSQWHPFFSPAISQSTTPNGQCMLHADWNEERTMSNGMNFFVKRLSIEVLFLGMRQIPFMQVEHAPAPNAFHANSSSFIPLNWSSKYDEISNMSAHSAFQFMQKPLQIVKVCVIVCEWSVHGLPAKLHSLGERVKPKMRTVTLLFFCSLFIFTKSVWFAHLFDRLSYRIEFQMGMIDEQFRLLDSFKRHIYGQ